MLPSVLRKDSTMSLLGLMQTQEGTCSGTTLESKTNRSRKLR